MREQEGVQQAEVSEPLNFLEELDSVMEKNRMNAVATKNGKIF